MSNNINNHKLDVFLSGELVDLCIPTPEFAEHSDWYSWLNEANLVQFLDHGVFPNTKKKQLQFFENRTDDRLVLIIADKLRVPIGVISLSFIDHVKKHCDIALIVTEKANRRTRPFLALESMCILTTHAFEQLGMRRISAGQHIKLAGWQNRLELIGYQLEGIHNQKFVKGRSCEDTMSIAIIDTVYDQLKTSRNGCIWDGYEIMKKRTKVLPKESYYDKLRKFHLSERAEYYSHIYSL